MTSIRAHLAAHVLIVALVRVVAVILLAAFTLPDPRMV